MSEAPVSYERRGPVAVVTIERPEKRNAVDRRSADALGDAWDRFEDDEDDALHDDGDDCEVHDDSEAGDGG
jgi:enoyl-CoA hydratase/carnithine racemase